MSTPLRLKLTVERKHPKMPRFVVVPSKAVAAWKLEKTTVVECELNDVHVGRRSLKRWDDDLPEAICRRAQIATGDSVKCTFNIAPTELPSELAELLERDPAANAAWSRLTQSQQRMLREHVAAAKQSATRKRRALRALCAPTMDGE